MGICSPYILSQQKSPQFPGGRDCDLRAAGEGLRLVWRLSRLPFSQAPARGPRAAVGEFGNDGFRLF